MKWGGYVFSGGMMVAENADKEQLATFCGRAKAHAERLTRLIMKDYHE